MKSLGFGLSLLLASTMMLAQNPVPFVNQPLVPTDAAPGGPSFTLTVNGTGFVSGSVVNWNGVALSTAFVASSQLKATVPASNIAKASTAWITVSSPTPGGGTSNVVFFAVSAPTTLQFSSFVSSNIVINTTAQPIAADFNGDGKLDYVLNTFQEEDDYGMETFLGNGDGTFQPPKFTEEGLGNFASGDFTGNGKLDLVGIYPSISTAPSDFNILLGNGDGTFSTSELLFEIPFTNHVVAGDFNSDGKLDVALSAGVGVYVFLGNGDGTFQSPLISSVGSLDTLGGVGDFNQDGKLDLIGVSGTQLAFLQGNGDGTFKTPSTFYTLGSNTGRIIAADLNGDGKLDLITVQDSPTNSFTVLLGNGNGTFTLLTPNSIGNDLSGGVIGDFSADGKLDLVLSNQTNTIILPGNGDGTFQTQSPVTLPDSCGTFDSAAGDFNNDGKLDLVLACGAVSAGNPAVYFLQETPVVNVSPSSLTFSDRLVQTSSSPQNVVLSNSGTGSLTMSVAITGANSADFSQTNNCPTSLAVGAQCRISLSFSPTAAGTRNAVLSVSDSAPGSPQTVALSGTGQDFSLAATPGTTTVIPGQTGNYTLTVSPLSGFAQKVVFSCSGAPSNSICTVSPGSVTLNGSTSMTANVAVVTARTLGSLGHSYRFPTARGSLGIWLAWPGFLGLVLLSGRPSWSHKRLDRLLRGFSLIGILSLALTWSACSGGGSSSQTPVGTYNVVLSGTCTSGTATVIHKVKVTLVVQ
jgi:hypothetical protein